MMPNPEDIISGENELSFYDLSGPFGERNWEEVIKRIREYGRQVRDNTLKWAAENADCNVTYGGQGFPDSPIVDKQSILKGKTSKELEI